jgi:hypothetical protein
MRRKFRPCVELMPGRIAPSGMAVFPDPMDPSAVVTNPGTKLGNPMDPSSIPSNDGGFSSGLDVLGTNPVSPLDDPSSVEYVC